MPRARRQAVSPLDDILNRNVRTRALNAKDASSLAHNTHMGQIKNVSALSVDELSGEMGDVRTGSVQVRADGGVSITRLNRILLFSTQATPTIVLPEDALTGSNILDVALTGQFYQNTGANQTITPRFYIGISGSETLVTSETALTVGPGATRKAFEYHLRVTAAPAGGTKVQVHEVFNLENATSGTLTTIMRSTRTTVIDITRLSEVNSCFFRIANGATPTYFRIYTNTLSVQVLDAVQAESIHWYSQPAGTDGQDAYIVNTSPTTNNGSSVVIAVGEQNSSSSTLRTVMKFLDIDNFRSDPDLIGFQLSEAYLYVTVSADQSSTTRTYELFGLLVDFVESEVTWNNRKAATAWGAAGGLAGTDYDATLLASCSFSDAESIGVVKSFAFSAYGIAELQKILDGINANYGFYIKAQTELNDSYNLHSAESATPEASPILYLIGTKPN